MKINGDNLILLIDTGSGLEPIAFATDCKLSIDLAMDNVTSKDSGGWEESIPSNAKFTLSTGNLVDYHPSTGYLGVADLIGTLVEKTLLSWSFTMKAPITGDKTYSGFCYVNKCEIDSKQGKAVTATADFTGTGIITITTT